jgi:glycosyltransferase involved in cell wall biosynthesis
MISPTTRSMKRVVILETQLKRYRERLFIELAKTLRQRGIELVIGYGDPSPNERLKGDTVDLEPTLGVKLPTSWWLQDRVVWQPALQLALDADLVIVGQANGVLFNYALLALSALGVTRVAYWGHGFNHQAERPGLSEWWKRKLVPRVDWWFAYTATVARYLEVHGVNRERITTVANTIDVEAVRGEVAVVDRDAVRDRLGLAANARVGLYCGALVATKQLGFVVDAAAELRRLVPTFELVIVGDGPERSMLEAIAQYRSYIHVVGPAFGAARAEYFAIAEVCLLPAHLGLAVVDAFAAGIPIATTDHSGHGPEREYLDADINAVITAFDVDAYTAAIARLLADSQRLAQGARATADELSLRRMVDEFASGIVRCVETA